MTTNRLAVAVTFWCVLNASATFAQPPGAGQVFAPPDYPRTAAQAAPNDDNDPGYYTPQSAPAAPPAARPNRTARPKFGSISAAFARQECPCPEEEQKEEEEKPCVHCPDGCLGCFGPGCCNVELDDPFKLGDQLHCLKKHDI
ncbi:MAG TPA: hypothetical protein VJ783_05080, partial [Pirellulales bacterium]|nr:hypothetical protein [Pirellulales bacterium]